MKLLLDNPASDGILIRLQIPALTEERRKDMAKVVRRMGEDAKVSIRNARRITSYNVCYTKLLRLVEGQTVRPEMP